MNQPTPRPVTPKDRKRYRTILVLLSIGFATLTSILIGLREAFPSDQGAAKALFHSPFWGAVILESGIALATTGLATVVITLLVGRANEKMTEIEELRRRVSEDEGVIATYSSDSDPLFNAFLIEIIGEASSEIKGVGLGLGYLSHNLPLVDAISTRMKERKNLHVSLYHGDVNSAGVKARIDEEFAWSESGGFVYDRNWVTRYPDTIRDRLRQKLSVHEMTRVRVEPCYFSPLISAFAVDDIYLFSMYGTPSMRGSESPWIAVHRRATASRIAAFIASVFDELDAQSNSGQKEALGAAPETNPRPGPPLARPTSASVASEDG